VLRVSEWFFKTDHDGFAQHKYQYMSFIINNKCTFVGDNKTHIFYEMHGEKIKITINVYFAVNMQFCATQAKFYMKGP
jgi:hypothetical protein